MKVDTSNFFQSIKKSPEQFFIVHYSSQSLFDEGADGLSPRITSIVVMHFATRQTVSFSVHTIAELLKIPKKNVESRYDEIEKRFSLSFSVSYATGWIAIGFIGICATLHLALSIWSIDLAISAIQTHLFSVWSIQLNLNDIFKEKYGDYAGHPRMKNLVLLNGALPPAFLDGAQEAAAFKAREFIRMQSSTICKVEFFRYAIVLAKCGKLRTGSKGWGVWIDRLLEGRSAKIAVLAAAVVGVPAGLYQAYLWLRGGG